MAWVFRKGAAWLALTTAATVGAAFVPLASGSAVGTSPLRVVIPWLGAGAACSSAYAPSVNCYGHPGGRVAVKGLGFVSQVYDYAVETQPGPSCQGGFFVLRYPARLIVRGKGEIHLDVAAAEGCLHGPPSETVLSPNQSFTITGGSGVYAGASGSGVVRRTDTRRQGNGHGAGTDAWEGTLVAPNYEFDTAAPRIRGAVAKVVRAPRRVSRVRVRYRLTATDAVDGSRPVACRPSSGFRFMVGRRTVVRCSATDTSANAARANFTVTVRRG